MIAQSLEGSKSGTVEVQLSAEMIRAYASAIGEITDKKNGHLAAPVTMSFIFWQFINTPWLQNIGPLIHGKQQFICNEPLYAGCTYRCFVTLNKIFQKGNKQFLEHILEVEHNGNVVVKSISTLILLVGENS